ncbi:unnamed protein product [Periconia digitata]|uniref:Uncharacterized protein n=1 Tax=Periconia digitata TaxID=1303443 RepID=A0A9W4UJI2_9PLEO|nr:unnamed protein product [Periconia digitata]
MDPEADPALSSSLFLSVNRLLLLSSPLICFLLSSQTRVTSFDRLRRSAVHLFLRFANIDGPSIFPFIA